MCGATGRNRFEPQKDQNLMFLVTVFQIGITDGAIGVVIAAGSRGCRGHGRGEDGG